MTKFKFGDKVWHEEHGDGIYFKPGKKCSDYVIFKDDGYATKVESYDLIIVDDWVKCSERMPDIDVEVLAYFDGYIYIDSLYYDKNLKEYWWQGNDKLPTHWMPLPEIPEVKE